MSKYRDLQDAFIEKNNVQIGRDGSKVKIVRRTRSGTKGWKDSWSKGMNEALSKTGVIVGNAQSCGLTVTIEEIAADYHFPFFVLELINEGK